RHEPEAAPALGHRDQADDHQPDGDDAKGKSFVGGGKRLVAQGVAEVDDERGRADGVEDTRGPEGDQHQAVTGDPDGDRRPAGGGRPHDRHDGDAYPGPQVTGGGRFEGDVVQRSSWKKDVPTSLPGAPPPRSVAPGAYRIAANRDLW